MIARHEAIRFQFSKEEEENQRTKYVIEALNNPRCTTSKSDGLGVVLKVYKEGAFLFFIEIFFIFLISSQNRFSFLKPKVKEWQYCRLKTPLKYKFESGGPVTSRP